jgi:hypothetical protein
MPSGPYVSVPIGVRRCTRKMRNICEFDSTRGSCLIFVHETALRVSPGREGIDIYAALRRRSAAGSALRNLFVNFLSAYSSD